MSSNDEQANVESDSDVLNTREAAAFLGAHIETVRRLARRGDIPSFKLGKDWRFRKEVLLRWADGKRPDATFCSVLIIDDEEEVCRVLSRAVERFGCHARYATNGEEGLRLVREKAPDLVLLDLVMPGMKGPRFLEELRKTHPTLPVVIVTGYPNSDLVNQMNQATQHAPLMLLSKPIEPELLERTVRMAAGNKPAKGVTP